MSSLGEGIVDVQNAFASGDHTVINWQGRNYYQACDEPVTVQPDGSGTFCVKRVDHPGDIHEDYDGVRKTDPKDRFAVIVTFPINVDDQAGYDELMEIMRALKGQLGDKEERLIYSAIRDTADQLIMILDGDG